MLPSSIGPSRTVLVVEDEPPLLALIEKSLRARGYRTIGLASADTACELLELISVDAVVTDLNLPMRGGHCFAAAAGALAHDAPVVVVTGERDLADITRKLAGALPRAVLPKPFVVQHLVAVVANVLTEAVPAREVDAEVTRELARSMARALALRGAETHAHAQRTALWARRLAVAIGLRASEAFWVEMGAYLHDVGKLGIPDAILAKPGPLDEAEWAVMRTHPLLGAELLDSVRPLAAARELVLHHHERWDGTGYPSKLAGDAIPLAARIFAPIDAYDEMTSDRPHHTAIAHKVAMERIVAASGTHFDPHVVEVLRGITTSEWVSVGHAVDGLMMGT